MVPDKTAAPDGEDSPAERGRRLMRNASALAERLPSVTDPAGKRATVRTVAKMATDGLRLGRQRWSWASPMPPFGKNRLF